VPSPRPAGRRSSPSALRRSAARPAGRPAVAAVFPVTSPPEALPEFAARVEELGYDGLWMAEDCFYGGGISLAATALAATRELSVCLGLMPASVRNAAIAAMEIATLARMHPGRFQPVFGLGVADWMRQIDAFPRPRLGALGEVVDAVRALLAGRTVTVAGEHVRLDDVALDRPPEPAPPVLIGTTGPKGIAVAGERADGLLVPAEAATPEFVSWALEQAGAPADWLVAVGPWLALHDDFATARSWVEPAIDGWLGGGLYPHPTRLAGFDPGVPRPAARDLPDERVRALGAIGDAEACAAAVARLGAAGADVVGLGPTGPDPQGQLERFAREALPLLRSA
jgi:5,10-methylenetetrahydromethanopterin reductase